MSQRWIQPRSPSRGTGEPGRDAPRTPLLSGLPPVLLESVPRRLAVASLAFATIWGLNLAASYIQMWLNVHGVEQRLRLFDHLVGPVFIGLALVFFFLSRRRALSPPGLVRLGLLFEVVGTFGVALATIVPVFGDPHEVHYFGIPWTCVWILAYPLMVPSRPRNSAAGGLLSTAAVAAAMALHQRYLLPQPAPSIPGEIWFWILFSNLLCAAWGTVGSVMINRLGRQVQEARRLGSYHLQELLGRGGMGEVWKARHRLLARPAAVKLIRAEIFGDADGARTALRRFEREAQVTAGLQSPHTVSLYDFGISDDGVFYYVMEYLDGIDLESLLKAHGPVSAPRVIHWLLQACHSLREAHHRGLIHRDIKPANLYACRVGLEVDVLKVLDFGLVKGDLGDGLRTLARSDRLVVGTPAYMAPESAQGSGEVDGRADLYSLGCVAFALLTGRPPFEGRSPMEVVLAHVQTPPPAPSRCTELPVPADLEAVILACMAKAPSDRPASAEELARRLGECVDAGGWTTEDARGWWELHRPDLT
jgi:serine/threonine-protein kinase